MAFNEFYNKNRSNLSAMGIEDLQRELNIRERIPNIFPLDVFHPNIKPYIHALNDKYDIPRSFIGLTLLSCYSTAIGTSYAVTTNGRDLFYLPVWSALVGISSSGKSLVIDQILAPLFNIQNEFDSDWDKVTTGLSPDKIQNCCLKTIIYRDAHLPTLVRYILPDNPKGILKYSDELLEWINGMNQLGGKKEGIDEQFWISSWNSKGYSGIRTGKQKFVIPRSFVNVIGGIQPSKIPKLFANDRDTTGFIFRVLFSKPETIKIADPDPLYKMPVEILEVHENSIKALYKNLIVHDGYDKPKRCVLTVDAIRLFQEWTKKHTRSINNLKDISAMEIESGILGKMKEYILRFSGILALTDLVLDNNSKVTSPEFFTNEITVCASVMERAIRIGDYFHESAKEIYDSAQKKIIAPPDVLQLAALVRSGKSHKQIALIIYNDDSKAAKQKVYREIKKYSKEYPKVFGSTAK